MVGNLPVKLGKCVNNCREFTSGSNKFREIDRMTESTFISPVIPVIFTKNPNISVLNWSTGTMLVVLTNLSAVSNSIV